MDTLTPEVLEALIDGLSTEKPAKRMVGTTAGDALEAAAAMTQDARRKAQRRRRDRKYHARKRREREEKARIPKTLSKAQARDSWRIVGPLWPVIEEASKRRRRQMARLGSEVSQDVASEVTERMAFKVHGAPFGVDELAEAAHELADADLPRVTKGARKWLIAAVNRTVKDVLWEAHLESKGVVSLEDARHAEAVRNALESPDGFYDRFLADAGCRLMGTRYIGPGQFDPLPMLIVVTEEITTRGLDRLVEVILANLRSDDTVAWKVCAEQVFRADPEVENAWDVVVAATADSVNPEERRATAARQRARDLFGWLADVMDADYRYA